MHYFRSLLENKSAINYLYVSMENIPDIIMKQTPSLMDLSITSTVVMTMQQIVGIIVKKQASGRKWLICEEIVDNVRVYIYCSDDDVDEVLKVELEQML